MYHLLSSLFSFYHLIWILRLLFPTIFLPFFKHRICLCKLILHPLSFIKVIFSFRLSTHLIIFLRLLTYHYLLEYLLCKLTLLNIPSLMGKI